ncbi:hypothetical protein ACLB2K_028927 [Fragaria x ananassa]
MAAGGRSSGVKLFPTAEAFGLDRSFTVAFHARAPVQEERGRGEGPNGTGPVANGGQTAAGWRRKNSGQRRESRERERKRERKERKKRKRAWTQNKARSNTTYTHFPKINTLK